MTSDGNLIRVKASDNVEYRLISNFNVGITVVYPYNTIKLKYQTVAV